MAIIIDRSKIEAVLSRYTELFFPSREEVTEKLAKGEKLSFYLGIDPTGPDLHLGHTTNLLLLKRLSELGHEIILLIGDFTAKIGDPTDKESTRKELSDEEIKENMKTYLSQVYKILKKGSFRVKYNSSWHRKIKLDDIVRLASHFTVQQMIARNMFQERIKKEKPIYLHEFLYPLMQGYDSVAMKIDGEIGGTDQTFNMLAGRDLEKDLLSKDKIIITTELLEDPITKKKIMNKSEGILISLNDSPDNMFGKIMALPDSTILPLYKNATEIPEEEINKKRRELEEGSNPKKIKEELALEIVRMYHGEKEAQRTREEFNNVFSRGSLPSNMEEFNIGSSSVAIMDILINFFKLSNSEAKRLIDQKAVRIGDKVVEGWGSRVKGGDIVRIGVRRFVKITT